jgi:hypothetical protein
MRIQTGNVAHDKNCFDAEVQRQQSVKVAANQAAATAAEITFFRTVRDSVRTTGVSGKVGQFNQVIIGLGGSP